MISIVEVVLFCEDRGHEMLLAPLTKRIFREGGLSIDLRVPVARGGASKVFGELGVQLGQYRKGLAAWPRVLVIAIDANSQGFRDRVRRIRALVGAPSTTHLVIACPDPYIERWYLADQDAFVRVVGGNKVSLKNVADYKLHLKAAVADAGHDDASGGIGFGPELAEACDLRRTSAEEPSFGNFVDQFRAVILELKTQ